MNAWGKCAATVLLAAGLAAGSAVVYAAHDEGGASSGHSDGKKGPKYMGGGNKGGSHSSASHKGGSAHHDSSEGGSKSTEDKIFHDKAGGHGGVTTESDHSDAH